METAKVRLVVHQSLQEVTARGGRVDDEDRFGDGMGTAEWSESFGDTLDQHKLHGREVRG